MKSLLALSALALLLSGPAIAQDETPGQQSTIVASVPTGGFNCGRAYYPEYCYGVPANVGGAFWLDCYYQGESSGSYGFIVFQGVVDLGQATITSASVTRNSQGLVTGLTIAFKGNTNDDGGTYNGTGTFTFSYYYSPGGGGRGGAGAGYRQLMQSGSLVITYQ